MDVGPDLRRVTAALAEPARLRMVAALAGGRALPAVELASAAGIRPPTAASHLARLLEAGLVVDERQGRHRYFRLASPAVATALEALSQLAPAHRVTSLRTASASSHLALARTCYDHLAGRLGVAIHDALLARGALVPAPAGYELGPYGQDVFADLGVDVEAARRARRAFAPACLDWSERTHHVAGALGAALAGRLLDRGWVSRRPGSRAVEVAAIGRRGLRATLGVDAADLAA
jgi:DNA-binding transcriptional ArsR family regulator